MQNVNLSVLFLASTVNVGVAIGIAVATLLIGCIVSVFVYKAITKKKVGSAKDQVGKILSDAKAEADQIKAQSREESKRALKEALLEAKEQDLN